MKLFSLKITVLIFFSSSFVIAQSIMVSTIDEFNLAMKKIVRNCTLKNGEWRCYD